MNAKGIVKNVMPPILVNALRKISDGFRRDIVRFTGDFPSWEDAQQASTGYAAPIIVARVRSACLRVKNREAVWERDSVVFDRIEYPFPLLAGLLRAAAENECRLSVLDFGGSLGSSYFQCRNFLPSLRELRWSIVEQPAYVAAGKTDFENEELRFYQSIEDCMREQNPNVLLLSGVVQYLPKPHSFIAEVVQRGFPNIIIDRTGFLRGGRDRLTTQHVPEWIYPAVYPCWFLSEDRFLAEFSRHYELLSSFPVPDTYELAGDETYFKGFIFKRKDGR